MGKILNSRKEKDKVILEVVSDYEEYLQLRGHLEDVYLFTDHVADVKANISQRGRNEATKYFLIPREFRHGLKFNNATMCQKIDLKESQKIWHDIKNKVGKVDVSDDSGIMTSSIYAYILKLVKEKSLDAISINCFPHLKGKVCIPVALLNDIGVPSACEGDLNSTILMYILYQLSGKAVSNGDQLKIYNLDKPNNSMMFSHCGAGAFTLAADKKEIVIHADYETG